MKRALWSLVALLALTLTSCAALTGSPPDPRPARLKRHVDRLVAKDADPADSMANAEAEALAGGLADDEAAKSNIGFGDLGPSFSAAGSAAASTGTAPGLAIGAALGTIGLVFTTAKTVMRAWNARPAAPAAASAAPTA